jgi:NAD/NADP transhydrogenase alpha subunit
MQSPITEQLKALFAALILHGMDVVLFRLKIYDIVAKLTSVLVPSRPAPALIILNAVRC